MMKYSYPSTGLDHLDEMLNHLQLGDNVVWQVDDIDDYREIVAPYVDRAIREQRKIVYFRFAQHAPMLSPRPGLEIIELDADVGFESFSTKVHNIIAERGLHAYYVFDSLSDLLSAWATDLMVGNFFRVTCPFLYELDTIAYFAILRDHHSFQTIARIRSTTQLLLDVYKIDSQRYIHPLKVWNRYSPTMFLPHRDDGDTLTPVTSSVDAARLFSYISDKARRQSRRKLDYWDRLFLEAEELLAEAPSDPRREHTIDKVCRIMIGRDDRMLALTRMHFSLEDLLDVKARLIGTGYIGGKAVGMLLARKILLSDASFPWAERLENHDSFYIGSDIFHTYTVQNGLWKLRMEQKTPEGYFAKAPELAEGLRKGKFPQDIREQLQEMIEYFGQSPIIVRSSSLLEDSFGNAFAGKYESLFLVNQGSPDERYERFEEAVRLIYASTVNEDALMYRRQRGLDHLDEQMSLLVQRVSGTEHGRYFFPDMAGVGVSYNTFVWDACIRPEAGMVRIVLGLGTRAVERVEDDYPRIVALDAPLVRPKSSMENIRQFSQRYVDVLNIAENQQQTVPFKQLAAADAGLRLDLLATEDAEAAQRMRQLGVEGDRSWLLTFDRLLAETDFVAVMRRMLETLQRYYNYPVDIEFTMNFADALAPQINLLQCRPLQTRGLGTQVRIPGTIPPERLLFASPGGFMGGSLVQRIAQVVFVDPHEYLRLGMQDKYNVARIVGKLNRRITDRERQVTLLIGPGRWGTTTPSLGVPVHFAEINNMAVMCEVSYPSGNVMPELSYGSHFFHDLVENQIFYVALFCERPEVVFQPRLLQEHRNLLTQQVNDVQKYEHVIKVVDTSQTPLQIMADIGAQKVVCFF